MLLGAEVGHLVGIPGAGSLIGMGLGFVAMAPLRGGAVLVLWLGIIFMAIGAMLLLGLAVPWKTVGALFTVLMGLASLRWGAPLLRASLS